MKRIGGKDNIGLVKYIENTFHYLYENEREKIVETVDKEYAVFNTGLVSKTWESIYAFLRRIRVEKDHIINFGIFVHKKIQMVNL